MEKGQKGMKAKSTVEFGEEWLGEVDKRVAAHGSVAETCIHLSIQQKSILSPIPTARLRMVEEMGGNEW